ncbi:MAG: response regulator [Acidobacteria bacterium]|nr:response regulator [Acidobacteriota bacterium]
MRLRPKMLALTGAVFFLLIVILYFTIRVSLVRGFRELEEADVRLNVERILSLMDGDRRAMELASADWASWDDTYQYIQDRNERYVGSNLVPSVFEDLRLNALVFVDSSGSIAFGHSYDFDKREVKDLPPALLPYVEPGGPLFWRSAGRGSISGFLELPEGFFMVVSRPILTSASTGPVRGSVIMGRILDRAETRRMGSILHLAFAVHRMGDVRAAFDLNEASQPLLAGEDICVRPRDGAVIGGYALVREIRGRPCFLVELTMPRRVHQQGQTTLRYLLASLLITIVVLAATMLLLHERLLLSRLEVLNSGVAHIAASGSLSGRVHSKGRDEISDLANAINRMLAALEHSHEDLRNSEERYRRLVEHSPDGILVHCDGRIVFANTAAARIIGTARPEDLNGRAVMDFLDPSFHAIATDRIRRILEEGAPAPLIEEKVLRLDGSTLDVEIAAIPYVFLGRKAVQTVVRDVTYRHLLEDQLRHAQKMEAFGQLAGGVAHDFNNLLQAMLGALGVLRRESAVEPRLDATIGDLEDHIRRGVALTRQLLLFARRDVSRPELLDLSDVVRHADKMLRRLVRENIRVILETVPDRCPVEADRGQVEQVLVNLVLNASDAMPHGGELVVRTGVGETSGEVWFEVQDSGTGMSEEVRARIFEPFFTTKPAGKGTGLGLAVVHGIVTRLGGRVDVTSEAGRGSRVRVILPSRVGSALAEQPSVPAPEESGDGRGERILLVEDEDGVREGVREMLQLLGYSVTAVGSGEEAQNLLERERFDVLITDLVLPGIHGAELARTWSRMKVIVMSGYAEDEGLRRWVSDGSVRFMQKPFDLETLGREVGQALRGEGTGFRPDHRETGR